MLLNTEVLCTLGGPGNEYVGHICGDVQAADTIQFSGFNIEFFNEEGAPV